MKMLTHTQSTDSLFLGAPKLGRHFIQVCRPQNLASFRGLVQGLLPPAGNLLDDTRPEFGSRLIHDGIIKPLVVWPKSTSFDQMYETAVRTQVGAFFLN